MSNKTTDRGIVEQEIVYERLNNCKSELDYSKSAIRLPSTYLASSHSHQKARLQHQESYNFMKSDVKAIISNQIKNNNFFSSYL